LIETGCDSAARSVDLIGQNNETRLYGATLPLVRRRALAQSAKVMRMSERGVENVFRRLRWPQTDGKPVCPSCGCQICYDCCRSETQPRWRCRARRADFSVTSGTFQH
jgi:hypothetical protein